MFLFHFAVASTSTPGLATIDEEDAASQ